MRIVLSRNQSDTPIVTGLILLHDPYRMLRWTSLTPYGGRTLEKRTPSHVQTLTPYGGPTLEKRTPSHVQTKRKSIQNEHELHTKYANISPKTNFKRLTLVHSKLFTTSQGGGGAPDPGGAGAPVHNTMAPCVQTQKEQTQDVSNTIIL